MTYAEQPVGDRARDLCIHCSERTASEVHDMIVCTDCFNLLAAECEWRGWSMPYGLSLTANTPPELIW